MKTILIFTLSLLFAGCAISHKRGSDAQGTVDFYLQNRGDLPNQLTKMVTLKDIKEAYVTVQWTVNDKGMPENITIEHDTLHNDLVNGMIIDQLKGMRFPKGPRFTTTTVEYTYLFKAQEFQNKK
ncbi:MAG: hypothetical protein RJB66_46 [Pseudomonadota bacterium]|jgi:hypothetical protein